MEPVGSSAGGSGLVSAGLETCQSVKKKCVDTVYSQSASYKKPKKPAAGNVVNSSAESLSLEDIGGAGAKPVESWGSEIGSVASSVSGLSDVKNMANMVAKETSYVESDENDGMDENTPRKTRTQTYMLDNPPKQPLFDRMSDNDDALKLPLPKFDGANQVPHIRSHALEKRNFEPVKSFALDIEVSAVPKKTNVNKLITVKKIFYRINGFEEASTPSKFPEIIRSSFTSEKSLIKARKMAIGEKILVNDNLKKINSHSDREVIVKEISVDLPKSAVDSAFSKFGKIVSIKIQLIGLWQKALVEFELSEVASLIASKWSIFMGKDLVRVALAVCDKQTWVSRDQHHVLLYTLSVGTTAHNLFSLLDSYGGKTCFIGRNPNSYVRNRCAVICFGNEASKLAVIDTIPVFKGVSLCWAGLSLASCTQCKQFGHVTVNYPLGVNSGVHGKRVVSNQDQIHLAGIYKKKSASIAHLVSFGGKTWIQVAGGSPSCVVPSGLVGAGLHSGLVPFSMMTNSSTISHLNDRLAILEHSLELLTDRVSGILVRLDSIGLVPVVNSSLSSLSAVSETLTSDVNSDMIVNTALVLFGTPLFIVYNAVVELSSSSSKVLTAKVDGLETKLIALEASVGLVLDKLNILCSGMNNCAKQADIIYWHKNMNNLVSIVTETKLRGMVHPWITDKFDGVRVFTSGLNSGHMKFGVAIIMDSFLVKHVCKILEVPGRLLSIKLLFGNKLFVSILGPYAGASSVVWFFQASDINSFVAKAVNKTSFVILGSDFNEDGFHKYASIRKCFDLGLVNSLSRSTFVKLPTWCNFHGVAKTIDYVLVFSSLVNTIVDRSVVDVEDFFDTDHRTVSVSVDLSGLLDVQLLSLCKQANKDHWKFDVKNASEEKWLEFKNATAANASMLSDAFVAATKFLDKDAMWDIVHKILILLAGRTFKKKWFKGYSSVFNKVSSKFHRLELLVSKLVKILCLVFGGNFASLLDTWDKLDSVDALPVKSLFLLGSGFDAICSELAKARKVYCFSKMMESKCTEESRIRQAIERRMESFEVDKRCTIRSVLEHSFHKVVLDHLVVDKELVLEPNLVKSKVDKIIEDWTRKHAVMPDISNTWVRQFQPLDYVFDNAFSEVMCSIGFDELLIVVFNLPNGKTAGLSGISNELWKHCDRKEGILTNTCPIALIETAHKILSKILSDRISLACSRFDVLHGDNFSVLKGMTMQSSIFAIGSVMEDALEKGQELWLVLQDM
ncbi:hypothetical protein G9A89_011364 [Geosiphon pyriformis]|nr:hypothetical protein G9A89_011364 [Geosiphon pyriformis]